MSLRKMSLWTSHWPLKWFLMDVGLFYRDEPRSLAAIYSIIRIFGLGNVPLFPKKVQNSAGLWRGRGFPRFLPGYKPANGVRRISARLQARRHQSSQGAPCASVCSGKHQCACLITVSSSPTCGISVFSVWLKRYQRFGSSVSALLEAQINQELFPISMNLFGKSSCFQMVKV